MHCLGVTVIEAKTYAVRTVSQALTAVLRDLVTTNLDQSQEVCNEILGAQIVIRDPRYLFPFSSARKFDYTQAVKWCLDDTRFSDDHTVFYTRSNTLYQLTTFDRLEAWWMPQFVMMYGLMGHLKASELGVAFAQHIVQIGWLHFNLSNLGAARLWLAGQHGDEILNTNQDLGRHAFQQVANGDTLRAVQSGQRPTTFTGAEPLVALLQGNYQDALRPLSRLKLNGHGIGWPTKGENA